MWILLEILVEGDGTKHKRSPNSWMLYKSKEMLSFVQGLCATHGIRSWISEYRKGHFKLNIHIKRTSFSIDAPSQKIKTTKNTDKVYCLSMPCKNFLCRRKGTSYFTGNSRPVRLAETVNIPEELLRDFSDIWDTPDWTWDWEFIIDNVCYIHGTGCGGEHPAYNKMKSTGLSHVLGHNHSAAGIKWLASPKSRLFGMDVGCGIDDRQMAFAYGQFARRRSIISCGVVIDGIPYHEVCPIGKGEKYYDDRNEV